MANKQQELTFDNVTMDPFSGVWRGFTVDVMYDIIYKQDYKAPIVLLPGQVCPVRDIYELPKGYTTSIHVHSGVVYRDMAGKPWWGTRDGQWYPGNLAAHASASTMGYGCGTSVYNLSESVYGLCSWGRFSDDVRSIVQRDLFTSQFYAIDSVARRVNHVVSPPGSTERKPDKDGVVPKANRMDHYIPKFWVVGDGDIQKKLQDLDRTYKWQTARMFDVASKRWMYMVEFPVPWVQLPVDKLFASTSRGDLSNMVQSYQYHVEHLMQVIQRYRLYVGIAALPLNAVNELYEEDIERQRRLEAEEDDYEEDGDYEDDEEEEEGNDDGDPFTLEEEDEKPAPKKLIVGVPPASCLYKQDRALTDIEYKRQQVIPFHNYEMHSFASAGLVPNTNNHFSHVTSPRAVVTVNLKERDPIFELDTRARRHLQYILGNSGMTDPRLGYEL